MFPYLTECTSKDRRLKQTRSVFMYWLIQRSSSKEFWRLFSGQFWQETCGLLDPFLPNEYYNLFISVYEWSSAHLSMPWWLSVHLFLFLDDFHPISFCTLMTFSLFIPVPWLSSVISLCALMPCTTWMLWWLSIFSFSILSANIFLYLWKKYLWQIHNSVHLECQFFQFLWNSFFQ